MKGLLVSQKRIFQGIFLNFAIISLLFAQFSIQGQMRPRAEFRHGYRQPLTQNAQGAFFISQRSRLTLGFQTELYQMKFAIQDVRVWGDEAHLQDVPSQALHEAWAQLRMNSSFSVRIGRQELVYDDHRLLGNVNWTQQARSHDAVVFRFRNNSLTMDFGSAYNNDSEKNARATYRVKNYRTLAYLWLKWASRKSIHISLYAIHETFVDQGLEATNTKNRLTLGPHLFWNVGLFQLYATGFLQTGKTADNRDILAYFGALQVKRQWGALGTHLGIEYLSGQDKTNTNRFTVFNTLYATNHKFYGTMDYFLNIPKDTRYGGLIDTYLKLQYDVTSKSKISIDTHYFRLASDVILPFYPTNSTPVEIKSDLGVEIDLALKIKVQDNVQVLAGYSQMFGTDSFFTLKGGEKDVMQNWMWFMVNVHTDKFSIIP